MASLAPKAKAQIDGLIPSKSSGSLLEQEERFRAEISLGESVRIHHVIFGHPPVCLNHKSESRCKEGDKFRFRHVVDVACMDVRCFQEESSDTIICCFCAGLETVKDAVVNPDVETPFTPVSPCGSSSILAPSAVAARIKYSGGTTEPDAISEASTRETGSTTTESYTEGSTSLAWTCVASRKKAATPSSTVSVQAVCRSWLLMSTWTQGESVPRYCQSVCRGGSRSARHKRFERSSRAKLSSFTWLSSVKSTLPNTENWLWKLYNYSMNNDKSTEDKHETNYISNKCNDMNTRNMRIT